MLIVKKFGGTSVANKERIFNVAKAVSKIIKTGNDVVVVLSAMGNTTDELITYGKRYQSEPKKESWICCLQQVNRYQCLSWLWQWQALDVPADFIECISGSDAYHITVMEMHRFKRIDTERIRMNWIPERSLIVTGFQGVNKYDDITTLGRGGSDTTAVALAAVLTCR